MAAVDHPPVTGRTRLLLGLLLVPLLGAAVAGAVQWWPDGSGPRFDAVGRPVDATVVEARRGACADFDPATGVRCHRIEVRLDTGGRVALDDIPDTMFAGEPVEAGDEVVVRRITTDGDLHFQLDGHQQRVPLALLALGAAAALVVLARWRGLRVLAALALCGLVLAAFAVPAALDGAPVAGVGAVAAAGIAVALLLVGRGPGAREGAALVGCLLALGAAALAADALVDATELTRLDPPGLERGVLLAIALVVGAAGAAAHLAVRVVDATWDLREEDAEARWFGVTIAGIRRARAALADTSGILALAYAGASLPTWIALTDVGGTVHGLTGDGLASEVVRLSLGLLVLAAVVPLTAAVAATITLLEGRAKAPEDPRRFRSKKEREIWG